MQISKFNFSYILCLIIILYKSWNNISQNHIQQVKQIAIIKVQLREKLLQDSMVYNNQL